ncbi:MAG: glutathione S-transferase family protein [Granulosicoccaceae bacterium]
MITLYDYLPSQNAWKVRLLLNQLEQEYTQQFISIFEGEGRTDEYRAINPTGAVPAITLPDGSVLAESNTLLVYLAHGSQFLPSEPLQQAQVQQWLFFESDYVQSTVATLRHWVMTGKDKYRSAEMLETKHQGSLNTLNVLDRRLSGNEFLAPTGYSIADMSVYAYVHLADEAGVPLEKFENVQRWINSVKAQPRYLDEVYPYSIDKHSYKEL